MRYLFVSACLLAGLSACASGGGGGGGGGGGAAPSTSTTTTTSSNPAPTNATLTNLTVSQSFANAASGFAGTTNSSTGSTTASLSGAGKDAISISYTASDQSYTVVAAGLSSNFLPSSKDNASSSSTATTYSKTSGSTTDSLIIPNAGALPLTYTSYGVWVHEVDSGATENVTLRTFAYGIPTAASDLPRTGSASYSTSVVGFGVKSHDVKAVLGSANFSADFGAGSTNLSMSLTGTSATTGATTNLGSYAGTGVISTADASFSGGLASTSSASAGSSGAYAGRFYGPQAAEVGISFSTSNASGDLISGAIIGKR